MLLSASLAAGSLFGYVGYTRPAFANGNGTCAIVGNTGTVSGSDNSALLTSLTDCLANVSSGGTINFDATDVPEGTQIDVSTPFSITKNVTIQGTSTTDGVYPVFDGGKTGTSGSYSGSALFAVDDNLSVTFAEVGLNNAFSTGSGAAISVGGSDGSALIFDSVKISGNTSSGSYAGAVYNVNGDVRFTSTADFKTVVSDNKGGYGGAVAANSMYVADSSFLNNEATASGGAVYLSNNGSYFETPDIGDLQVKSSSFIGNNSDSYGGAIFDLLGNTDISSTVFQGNASASFSGGALASSSNITINSSQFVDNAADNFYGGAIYAYNADTLEINDSLFESNSSYDGGAVTTSGLTDAVSVNRSTFYANSAIRRGGAIVVFDGFKVYTALLVENSTFYKNEATQGAAIFDFVRSYKGNELNFSTVYKNYDSDNDGTAAIMGNSNATGTINNSIVAGNSNADDPSSTADFETKFTASSSLTSADGSIGLSPVFVTHSTLGQVFSHLLPLSDSQALDAADPLADLSTTLATDQLGNSRTAPANIGAVDIFGYKITTTAGENGSISPGGNPAVSNQGDKTFTVTPDANYQIATVTVDGADETIADNSTFSYTFNDVSQNHTIAATFEAIPTPSSSAPVAPRYPVISMPGTNTHVAGDEVTAEVRNWNDSARIFIGDIEAEIVEVIDNQVKFIIPEVDPGNYSIVIESNLGKVTVLVDLEIEKTSIESLNEPFGAWTKKISDTEVKVYAKNPIGNGKVQFFVDGNEIAWVRAEDEEEPKLRQAAGSYYLVRTVKLTDSKQAIEIYLDGERVWRAAYTASR
jgi:hypothetical protein